MPGLIARAVLAMKVAEPRPTVRLRGEISDQLTGLRRGAEGPSRA